MTRFTLALLAASALVAPAYAADFVAPVYDEPATMTVSDWSGFYVGIFGGATFNPDAPGILRFDQTLTGNFVAPVGALGVAFGQNFIGSRDGGGTVGFELGYDWQMDNFVVGVVGDLAAVNYADRQSAFSATPASYTETTSLTALATLRARAGVLVDDNLLAYVHGGLAAGNVTSTFVSVGNPNAVPRGSAGTVGFQVGAGLEGKVTETISLGVQYDYTNLGGRDFVTRFANGPFAPGTDVRGSDQTFDFHTVKGTLKYHF